MTSKKLTTSHPTQAVGTSDNGRRPDGDGRVTAGNPLVGVGAAGADGGHPCKIPLLQASPGMPEEPSVSQRSWRRHPRSMASAGGQGTPVMVYNNWLIYVYQCIITTLNICYFVISNVVNKGLNYDNYAYLLLYLPI